MKRVIICDDEPVWYDMLSKDINRWCAEREETVSILSFSSGSDLVEYFAEGQEVDTLFLDIALQESFDGIEAARRIRDAGNDVPIIFVSSYIAKASEGYEVDAIGFLVKNYSYDKLASYLDKAMKRNQARIPQVLIIESKQSIKRIFYQDIVYVESFGHEVNIYTETETITARMTLSEISDKLTRPSFIQIHKSFIVATRFVVSTKWARPCELILRKGEKTIPLLVGRTYVNALQELYAKSLTEELL